MSELLLKTAYVSGTPSESVWAQAHTFDSFFLIVVLKLASETPAPSEQTDERKTNLAAAGKGLFVQLEQSYQENNTKNLALLRTLFQDALAGANEVEVATIVAGMIVGTTLYAASKNGKVFLKRNEKLLPILTSGAKPSFASGFVEDNDLLLLVSEDVASLLDKTDHQEFFTTNNPQEIGEALSSVMHKTEQQEKQIAFIALVKQKPSLLVHEENEEEEIEHEANTQGKNWFHQTRRVTITVFLLLAILLFSSLVLGVKKRREEQAQAQFTAVFSAASQKYDEGMALSDLNPQLSSKTLSEAKDLVGKALRNRPAGGSKEELTTLEKKIDDGLQKALRIQTFSDVPLFFEVTLIKDGAEGIHMSLVDGKMLILDSKNGALYTLTVSSKQAELVSGNIQEANFAAEAEGIGYVLYKDGIERVLLKTKKREKVVDVESEWGDTGGLATFGGNLYLLDKSKQSIYKYQATENGFSSRRSYLGPGIAPDFSNAMSLAIDGSVWVLFLDGRISKFIQGAPQSFSIQGIDIPLNNPKALFSNDESKYLYILDSGNKRVVVVSKDGTYNSQYRWEGVKDVSDIVVSEKEKKILLLSGSKIYDITLNN